MPGKGFQHTPAESEIRRYSSWGRTRSPKNILSIHRSGINAAGAPKELLNGADAISCITENQRYLHVVVTSATSNSTLKIEGEMYAAARDTDADGKLDTFEAIPLTDTQGTAMNSAGPGHYLIEIGGIDRIKFSPVGAAAEGNKVVFYAACSTFSMS